MPIYRFISCFWNVDNGAALLSNKDCYKILSFDEQDDVIDMFSSLPHAVASKNSTQQYSKDPVWRKFYLALCYLFKLDSDIYDEMHP